MHGEPLTKYAALFHNNAVFDGLRYSFLQDVQLSTCTWRAFVPSDMHGNVKELELLHTFCEECLKPLAKTNFESGPPKEFLTSAWPIFIECISCESNQYWLSYVELLLVCEWGQRNVVIFSENPERFDYLCSVTGHEGNSPVLVALWNNNRGRVRSHYQRLKLMEHRSGAHFECDKKRTCPVPASETNVRYKSA